MFGARAREAEYNAFMNATARQASREAEDQSLPPKSATLPLSAFSKPTHLNRNKGQKGWKRLIFDDSTEEVRNLAGYEPELSETMHNQYFIPDHHTQHMDTAFEMPTQPNETGHPAANFHEIVPPNAPRAMRQDEPAVSACANPTLRRLQRHAIVNLPRLNTDFGVPVEDSTPYPTGVLPYALPYWSYFPEYLTPSGPPQNPVDTAVGYIYGPDSLSPCKQEVKLAEIKEEMRLAELRGSLQQPAIGVERQVNTGKVQPSAAHFENVYVPRQHPAPPVLQSNHGNSAAIGRPALQHFESGPLPQDHMHSPFGHAGLSGSSFTSSNTGRRDHSVPIMGQQQSHNLSHAIYTPERTLRHDASEEKQRAMAQLRADSGTGKTVLRHQERDNSTSTPVAFKHQPFQSPDPSVAASPYLATSGGKLSHPSHQPQQPFPCQGSPRILGPNITASEVASLQRVQEKGPPPGLSSSGSATSTPSKLAEPKLVSEALSDFARYFGVGEASWYELKPTTATERCKMRQTASYIEEKDKFYICRPSPTSGNEVVKKPAWLQSISHDAAPQQVNQQINKVVNEYMHELALESTNPDNAMIAHEVAHAATRVRAIGHVMANIADYKAQQSLPKSRRDPFATFQPVPEFAVERNSLSSDGDYSSVFENDGSGFVRPPTRIARDPRFRSEGSNTGSPGHGFGRMR